MTGMVAEQDKGEMYLVGYTQAQEAVSLLTIQIQMTLETYVFARESVCDILYIIHH